MRKLARKEGPHHSRSTRPHRNPDSNDRSLHRVHTEGNRHRNRERHQARDLYHNRRTRPRRNSGSRGRTLHRTCTEGIPHRNRYRHRARHRTRRHKEAGEERKTRNLLQQKLSEGDPQQNNTEGSIEGGKGANGGEVADQQQQPPEDRNTGRKRAALKKRTLCEGKPTLRCDNLCEETSHTHRTQRYN